MLLAWYDDDDDDLKPYDCEQILNITYDCVYFIGIRLEYLKPYNNWFLSLNTTIYLKPYNSLKKTEIGAW